MNILEKLVKEAQVFGSAACNIGRHRWETDGGRTCPRPEGHNSCSQPVFKCADCGEHDYGNKGGPGHEWCSGKNCPPDWMNIMSVN